MSRPQSEVTINKKTAVKAPLRFVTAASLFDGHDAAINIMRRLIQAQGCEVVHLGHNRSVLDISSHSENTHPPGQHGTFNRAGTIARLPCFTETASGFIRLKT